MVADRKSSDSPSFIHLEHSTMSTSPSSSTSYNKAPPKLSVSKSYNDWVKLINIWLALTPLEKTKQGPALILSLEGKAQEVALQLDANEISAENGAQNVINKLNSLYKKDALIEKFNDVESYETYKRPNECSIKDFVIEFEKHLYKIKSHGIQPSDDLSAYRLLKAANLSSTHEQMIKATINNLTFDEIKTKLMKVFSEDSNMLSDTFNKFSIKDEATYYSDRHECSNSSGPLGESDDFSDDENDTYFMKRGRNYRYQNAKQDQYRGKSYGARPKSFSNRNDNFTEPNWRSDERRRMNNSSQKGKNPIDKEGKPTRCLNCESINHWSQNCPDKGKSEQTYVIHEIVLHQNDMSNPEQMKTLVAESWSSGLLDCGASKTVCGKIWLDEYINSLSENDKSKIVYYSSSSCYRFGDGEKVQAHQGVKIPAYVGNTSLMIKTDVIDKDLPLLLSKAFMKNGNMVLNFQNDTASIFDESIPLTVTSSGHYVIPISKPKQLINSIDNIKCMNITLTAHKDYSNEQIALKLHRQFGHPTKDKLLQLINLSDPQWSNNEELKSCINRISSHCETCQKYQSSPARPTVGLPMATRFCEAVAMDLKEIDGKIILHLIDMCTRLSAGMVVNNKQPISIIRGIFKCFLQIYGSVDKILVDNGGEFANNDFISVAEGFGINVKTTAAFSPWSNGMIERHNRTVAGIVRKILTDSDIEFEVALAWAFNAKNSLCNVHGFSPFQLSIGRNPKLPCSINDALPALTNKPTTKVLQDNLNALHKARKAFIELESSDRIKRALSHNIRTSSEINYISGDSVYFKRPDQGSWHGPGKVLGQDGQQVLIKNGSYYVRAHKCNVRLVREDVKQNHEQGSHDEEENSNDDIITDSQNSEPVSDYENDPENNQSEEILDEAMLNDNPTNNESSTNENSPENNLTQEFQEETLDEAMLNNENETIPRRSTRNANKINYKDLHEGKLQSESTVHYSKDDDHDYLTELSFLADVENGIAQAKIKELQQWKDENVYTEIENTGQEAISVTWVIRPKMIDGVASVKARLCARGFEEEQLFRTDSPSASREGNRMILAIIAANCWELNSLDVKTAFLQGKPIERDVYIIPPKEAQTNYLWKLNKTVYGLADANRNWYLKLKDELITLNGKPVKLDASIFTWFNKDDKLIGVMSCFVDDVLWGGLPEFKETIVLLKKKFKIGSEHSQSFSYIGSDLHQNQEFEITVNQNEYASNLILIDMEGINLSQKHRTLNDVERKRLRSALGQLNWLACMSRPEISFSISQLSSKVKTATVAELIETNKIIKFVKSTPSTIKIPKLDLTTTKVAAFSDASFNNLDNGGSQGGHVVFLCDNKGACMPVAWSSNKVKRVVRSTLAAETLALTEGADTAFFVAALFKEVYTNNKGDNAMVNCFTDSRSLFEVTGTSNLVSDKRLRVEVAAIREMIDKGEITINWVGKESQLSDSLTKKGASASLLLKVLKEGNLSQISRFSN